MPFFKTKKQIKANSTSVSTDLGGGMNGHLGLVPTPEEYTHVVPIPYVRLLQQGALNIPLGTIQQ